MTAETQISLALIDDSLPLRKLIGIYLAKQGFDIVCEADNGEQFLIKLAQSEKLPDLCLLDSNMPGMSGHETARHLRENYPSIQIMAYSFFDENVSADSILQSGVHNFINKDADAHEVRDALKALYNKRAGA